MMPDDLSTVSVTIEQRDATVEELCVNGEAVGRIDITENFSTWKLTEHGTKLGLEIGPAQVLSFVHKSLIKTLVAMVERQLLQIATGSALTDGDRNLLYPELRAYLGYTAFPVLRHPLVYMVPYSASSHEAVMANARFEHISKQLDTALQERTWVKYIHLYERPYRLEAFGHVAAHMDDEEYWETLSGIWTDSENINQNIGLWKKFWSSKRPARECVMDEEERAAFAAMPETLTIYRGTTPASNVRGMSWTLTPRTAHWFGNRYVRSAHYFFATAEVAKADVLAYLLRRNETEIVVLSSKLRNMRREKVKVTKRR